MCFLNTQILIICKMYFKYNMAGPRPTALYGPAQCDLMSLPKKYAAPCQRKWNQSDWLVDWHVSWQTQFNLTQLVVHDGSFSTSATGYFHPNMNTCRRLQRYTRCGRIKLCIIMFCCPHLFLPPRPSIMRRWWGSAYRWWRHGYLWQTTR